ncbi:hypothetical protein BTO06_18150 [Tenacibaculum sp. SZ-18]|uniref:hypothetical protein n=1 Tax=Tenacibaculum sp. SZ-18 TaxID=754423 RepID=UPI000C2D1F73|nr:hypothetical protein [Tenacibaculum sp. SZ-18]AUC16951.1 hypothetical protein BTO06_18150 [Tenacibaculum sp. SZ-18]
MKKLIYIIGVLFLWSCANDSSLNKEAAIEEVISNVVKFEKSENAIFKEKLTRYFDLLKLKEIHPDFETDLISQLQNLSQNDIIEIKNLEGINIENITVVNNILKVSDSIEKVKLTYNIVGKNFSKKDSIYAYKTSTEIMIDGYPAKSFDIKFAKE